MIIAYTLQRFVFIHQLFFHIEPSCRVGISLVLTQAFLVRPRKLLRGDWRAPNQVRPPTFGFSGAAITSIHHCPANMTDPNVKAAAASGTPFGHVKPEKPPNPVWRMMGVYCTVPCRAEI